MCPIQSINNSRFFVIIIKLHSFVVEKSIANILPRFCTKFFQKVSCSLIYYTCCICFFSFLRSRERTHQIVHFCIDDDEQPIFSIMWWTIGRYQRKFWKEYEETPFIMVVVQSYTFLLGCITFMYVNMQQGTNDTRVISLAIWHNFHYFCCCSFYQLVWY